MSWQIPLFHWLGNDPRWHLAMLVFAALTAGLFEECGRWVAFRYLLPKRHDAPTAVMLGPGTAGWKRCCWSASDSSRSLLPTCSREQASWCLKVRSH